MSDDAFNMSMRKFLKQVGVTSQQKIEDAVRQGQAAGTLSGDSVRARVVLTLEGTDLEHIVDGEIQLRTDE